MHRYPRQLCFAAIAALGLIGPANAYTVGSEPLGSAINDIIGGAKGYFGANLYGTGAMTIEYTYLGKEAGFDNGYLVLGTTVFDTNSTAVGALASETLSSAGLLNFSFHANEPGGPSVANGANVDATLASYAGQPNFFVSFFDPSLGSNPFGSPPYTGLGASLGAFGGGYQGIIALDDGGAGPDKDFDDLVVGFRVLPGTGPGTFTAPVPEASTWAMMLLGFCGLGFVAHRRRVHQASMLTAA